MRFINATDDEKQFFLDNFENENIQYVLCNQYQNEIMKLQCFSLFQNPFFFKCAKNIINANDQYKNQYTI